MADAYPAQVEQFHDRLRSLPGVLGVSSEIQSLDDVQAGSLGNSAFARLPHATLRRTDGGIANEVLVQFEVTTARSEEGWRAVEFLAWFFRDQARGGETIQIRPFGLPPVVGNRIQLGGNPRFHVDLFVVSEDGSLKPILVAIAKLDEGLRIALDVYKDALYS